MKEATLEPVIRADKLVFNHLPAYARFIRQDHLIEYIAFQLKGARELNTPLLKIFGNMPDQQIIEASIPGHTDFLRAAEENRLRALLMESMKKWVDDQLDIVGRDEIEAEDIMQVSYLRKNALLHFLPRYTSDVNLMLDIIREIDIYKLESDTIGTNTYIDILQNRITDHTHFIESIANTSPGIIYVFDIINFREIYSNDKAADLFGYSHDQLQAMGSNVLGQLMHPDDAETAFAHLKSFADALDGEVIVHEYRIRNNRDEYRWVRAHESVFKRDAQGRPVYIIGISQDITDEKLRSEALKHNEEQLLEAQRIADLGNFEWDMINREINVSPQLMEVLDLDRVGDFEYFINKVHPADKVKIKEAMDEAMKSGDYECEYRLYTSEGRERIIWSRGFITFEQGQPAIFKGTVMNVTEKHHMVQRLQRSEELYKQAQALSHIGNWFWDLMHQKFSWSEEIYRIYGIENGAEINYDLIHSFVHPEDAEMVTEVMQQAVETQQPFDFYYRIISKNGSHKILHARGEILVDNGKPFKMIGTLQDVTERQTLLGRLQESEQLYKEAQARTHIGNWSWDILKDKVTWSDEMYRIYELEPQSEEMTLERYLSFVHPDEKDARLLQIQEMMTTGKPCEFYFKALLGNGTFKIIHSKSEIVTDEAGRPVRMIGTCQDVTEQQLIEKELRENREFIQKIANTTPSLITSYNVNTGKYTYINQALHKILGYDPADVIEDGVAFFMSILHPEDAGTMIGKNTKALQEANANPPEDGNEMVVEFKYRLRHIDGRWHWFHTYGTIFDRNEQGFVEHVLNVSVDITEQEEAEQALQQKNIQLQQSNASLEEYAYVASHDLKEPLRKIATFSDRLITTQYDRLSEDGRLYLDKIIDSSRRMQTMIGDLLSVSVISGNKAFEVYSLKDIFKEVVQTLEYKIEEKGAVVVSDDLPPVRIVASQFRQLFQNLVGNSLKFTRQDVIPEIRISHDFLQPWQVTYHNLAKASRYLRITVTDNGIGFDNQFANKIFAIFQRLHSKTEYEGTGIGLAICRKIAENHGGTISAEGILNQGSIFTIIIPA